MSQTGQNEILRALTAQVVAAYAAGNMIATEDLLRLIETVYTALAAGEMAVTAAAKPQPAAPMNKSVFPDYIICLEDGRKLKMLKRHLLATYNLTPDQYREKWGLPSTYPMVAPAYAATRAALAKASGLGKRPVKSPSARSRRAA